MPSLEFGAIELPQEANPLNPETLYNVLSRASSTNQQQVQSGTQQLQNWERQPGFFSSLQSVFINASLPIEVRFLSAIQLKNGIDKYWRKTAANAISKEEKALIRSRCLESGINEPNHQLALQNALVTAKIIRFEFPHEWPDAITSLTQHLRVASQAGVNPIHLSRTLLILLYIIKELATGRLQRTRTSLQIAAPEVCQVLGKIYVEKGDSWMKSLQKDGFDEGKATDDAEGSLLALRVLRRLLIAGYEFPNRQTEVQEFWTVIEEQFVKMLPLVTLLVQPSQLGMRSLTERHLVQMSKLHLEMVRVHPAAFALLPNSFGLARAYWSLLISFGQTFGSPTAITSGRIGTDGDADEGDLPYMEKLSLKGLLLLRGCVKMVYSPTQTFKYLHAEDKEERKRAIAIIKTELLLESAVRDMMETLVTRFFVFRPRDLREWEEEPGEWERREEGEGDVWEFSIRSCAEKLFLDLVINNKDLLIQPLLNVFHSVATPQNTDILLKDSIYAAVGLAAPVLEQHLDFATVLNSTLIPEIQVQQPGYNILRRRIAILLGQWLTIKEGLDRPLVYQLFQYLLDKDDKLNDQVVRVTAARQLKNVVDPFEFTAETFMPYAPSILARVMALIEEVELGETKMALLNTVSVVVIKMEHHIIPFADQIISLLPPLWEQAGDEYLMKQSILAILSALVTSMKDASRKYHPLILPLIQSSVEPESETRTYLLEDAVDLWHAILIQTPEPTQEILNLARYLIPMFDTATDTLRKALDITESYFLLAPHAILQACTGFVSVFANLLGGQLKREANGVITYLVEILVRAADSLGGSVAVEALTKNLIDTQLLSKLLTGLKVAYDAHQTTGPNRVYSDVDGIVETDYLSVLARIAFASPSTFIAAIDGASPRNESLEDTMRWLFTEWFSHSENVGTADKKKLMCLALTSFLKLGTEMWSMGYLQDMMTMWTDVITECVDYPEEGGEGKDTLIYWDMESLKGGGIEAPEDIRRRNIAFADPVHRINIKDFICEHLQQAIDQCGGQEAFQQKFLVDVDEDVVKAFGNLGVL